jgi:hypothetical protein
VLALPAATVETLIERCWNIDEFADVGALCRATIPRARRVARARGVRRAGKKARVRKARARRR